MIDTILQWVPKLVVGLTAGLVFVISPFSNILNLVTVPLGYEWSSCPNCPDVTVRKITWAECAFCGDEHRENFGAARWQDGERIPFCGNDCLDAWKEVQGS